MIRYRIASLALAAIATAVPYVPPAMAAKFDGNWSMVAVTTRGHCGVIPMGLEIHRGRIQSTGGSFALYPIQVGGSVSANGQVRMKAVAGPRIAHGTGRFGKYAAKGTWKGRGPSGLCSGVWNASRS
jgi:hypothetical protein